MAFTVGGAIPLRGIWPFRGVEASCRHVGGCRHPEAVGLALRVLRGALIALEASPWAVPTPLSTESNAPATPDASGTSASDPMRSTQPRREHSPRHVPMTGASGERRESDTYRPTIGHQRIANAAPFDGRRRTPASRTYIAQVQQSATRPGGPTFGPFSSSLEGCSPHCADSAISPAQRALRGI